MKYLNRYNDFINENQQSKGFFGSLWSVLTLGGYVTSKIKNVIGFKSILIKNKISAIQQILQDGLKNLFNIFPTERIIAAKVDKNSALQAVKTMSSTTSDKQVGINTYNKLRTMLFQVERAIMIYEKDTDLELIKSEIEKICNDVVEGKQPEFPDVETQIQTRIKTLRLNKKLIQELTQKLPRYDLKNLSLEASALIRTSTPEQGKRLELLFQQQKNKVFSKYEKYYDFDDLNNWLDYEKFDPSSVKYREQIEEAKRVSDKIFQNNKISAVLTMQNYKPMIGEKYYFFFEEEREWRALMIELIGREGNMSFYKPYGIYKIKKSGEYEFKKMVQRDLKKSMLANVDIINTKMILFQDKIFFGKDGRFFGKTQKHSYDSVIKENLSDIIFNIKDLKGFGILKIDNDLSNDKIDTDNWKKYETSDFKKMMRAIQALEPMMVKKDEEQKEQQKKEVEEPRKKIRYNTNVRLTLIKDVEAFAKTMKMKLKETEIEDIVKKFLDKKGDEPAESYDELKNELCGKIIKEYGKGL